MLLALAERLAHEPAGAAPCSFAYRRRELGLFGGYDFSASTWSSRGAFRRVVNPEIPGAGADDVRVRG